MVSEQSSSDSGVTAPFPWYGGKKWVAPLVWERFGNVPNYCEPFFGSGAVLLARPHAPGTETANDACGFVSNFWRAVQADPENVAHHADWPVSEPDLHARHLWLVNEGKRRVERLKVDPTYFDPQVAGWWVWGLCLWIGSGWCSGKGPHRLPEASGELAGDPCQLPHLGSAGQGINRKPPHLGDAGRGVHRPCPAGNGVPHQLPYLSTGAQGVCRQLPHLGDAGRGEHRAPAGVHHKLPQVGNAGRGVPRPGLGQTCAERREALFALLLALQDRLRKVRVACGDWTRVLGPSVTTKHGLTAVFLDPPYSHSEREAGLYSTDEDCASAAQAWALANGDNPLLRIGFCGYFGEHEFPSPWECVRWKARGGYGSQGNGRGRENAEREAIWFNPSCLKSALRQPSLFDLDGDLPAPHPVLAGLLEDPE